MSESSNNPFDLPNASKHFPAATDEPKSTMDKIRAHVRKNQDLYVMGAVVFTSIAIGSGFRKVANAEAAYLKTAREQTKRTAEAALKSMQLKDEVTKAYTLADLEERAPKVFEHYFGGGKKK